jgi:hypothetical protein
MQYKTIVLRLLEENHTTYDQLRRERLALAALVHYSWELKARHQGWIEELRRASPKSDPSQISSQALELALRDLQADLPNESTPSDAGTSRQHDLVTALRHSSPE